MSQQDGNGKQHDSQAGGQGGLASHWVCPACHVHVPRGARCTICGRLEPYSQTRTREAGGVVITGLDLPFGNLVVLLIKLAIAAIPAGIIVMLIYLMLASILGYLFAGML